MFATFARQPPIVLAVAFSALVVATKPAGPLARFEKVCTPLVAAVNAGDYEAVGKDFNATMAKAFPPRDRRTFFEEIKSTYGAIRNVHPGRYEPPATALFPVTFEKGAKLDIKIVLDNRDRIAGLWILPHTAGISVPSKNSTPLKLPVSGWWYVFGGGQTRQQNQHHDTPNQRFAMDLVVVDSAGRTHKGDGLAKEDYYAFGQDILAPADGKVTDVIRGVRDNVPGSMNGYSALGNAVFIRHRDHEISVLAHLKLGSARVAVGDRVKAGQVIGQCGNSGNSSEPHLHYHMMNTPIIQQATGIKCSFNNVAVKTDGQTAVREQHFPVKGENIRSRTLAGKE